MNEFLDRQVSVLHRLVSDYRDGVLNLNSLIQGVEGVRAIIDSEEWAEAVFPLISLMEEINGVALDAGRHLTVDEKKLIDSSLIELDAIISRLSLF
ncbi:MULTISPECIES: hypothetical protein [Pseudomonas syringae group]|uniref:Uncharacterized protein n=4 Tax=Pseudomonas syringae group TaxID=136849 RepID=A0A2K4WW12_PSESX|nr:MULTISPECIES: hypothetical protein [Pseudomonas syringae group]AVB14661.1 hypothetical protein BKM19_014485 [Pseudomonas amygdali pv. morsprunorum]KWS54833.1 hypothetical protein AL056_06040 [Pseudomonas amygdali pv. morsprunorum]KWS68208.1 hypothetical protein AL054_20280 [Pseudomonas amygdali pv. morsprunorum]KWS71025.1 hypothetical protein AL052_20475 [Pseudomonas amygdali pv. eriobotryae]MBD1107943.1 hypothetical protein [Pseudomonas amygdali pv. morsprunorum]